MNMLLWVFCLRVCLGHQDLHTVVSWEPSPGLLQLPQVLLTAEPFTIFCDVTVDTVIALKYSILEHYCRLGYMVNLYLHHFLMPPEILANAGQLLGIKLSCGFLVKTDVLTQGQLNSALTLCFFLGIFISSSNVEC